MKLLLLVLFAGLAQAATIQFDQSPPNGNNFDITDYRLADDFSLLVSTDLTGISFWYQAQDQSDLAVVTYAVYLDAAGAPGSLVQSETVNMPVTSLDSASGLFFASFNIAPLHLLGGGGYWLELHAGNSLTDASGFTVSWAAADDNVTAIAMSSLTLGVPDSSVNVSGFNQYAFELFAVSAPEPAPFAPVSVGLFFLFLTIALRRSQFPTSY